MSQNKSIIIIFEPRAILAGSTRDWSQFSQLGVCYLPQIVLEELEFLTKRAISDAEEKTAREFFRFFPDSGWQVSQGMTHHDSLTNQDGDSLSKNARLQQAIAESTYYISLENPSKLVVFVGNNQNLREEIENLGQDNLVTLTLTQFIQWLRTQQKPLNVAQKIASMGNGSITTPKPPISGSNNNKEEVTLSSTYQTKAKVKAKNNTPNTIISGLLALSAFGFVILTGWYFLQPQSFQQFWQKTGLPSLNQQKN